MFYTEIKSDRKGYYDLSERYDHMYSELLQKIKEFSIERFKMATEKTRAYIDTISANWMGRYLWEE